MKKTLTAGLVIAGIIAVSGSALAAPKKPEPKLGKPPLSRDIREDFSRKHPPMSRDIRNGRSRPPLPPDKRHPRASRDKKPPVPPKGVAPKN